MIGKENSDEKRENQINQMHKNLDNYIQNCLNKFQFVEVKKELYQKVGDDINSIISHKSTIPDLIIWNKPFNKNECFQNMRNSIKYNKFPRVPFYLRLNNKEDSTRKRKNICQHRREEENYEVLVDFVDKLNIKQNSENMTKKSKQGNELCENIINTKIPKESENNLNVNSATTNKTSDTYSSGDKSGNKMNYTDKEANNNKINIFPLCKNNKEYVTPVNKEKKIMNDFYQEQFKKNELLMSYVDSYLNKRGWILFRNDGDYLSNFTSFELFTFLTNCLKSKMDLKIYIIGMQNDSQMFNGEQIFIILSQTLPMILQKKQLEYEMMKKKKIIETNDKKLLKINNDEKENISDNCLPEEINNSVRYINRNLINKDTLIEQNF